MKKFFVFWSVLACFCGLLFAEEPIVVQKVAVVVPLDGEVTEAQFLILRRALKAAEKDGAAAFVIRMNTPGGSLGAATKILELFLKAEVPTYTWVDTNAGSAGALIALGTDHIYMAPVSAIGAAAPVISGGQEVPETMNAKIVSYYSGYFRSAAEKKGYRPGLAEAFIDKDKGFQIGEEVITAKGTLLTLSAQEAVRRIDGKPILADGIAGDIGELLAQAGLGGAKVEEFHPSGFETLAVWITVLAPLFLLGGIAGVYIEFKSPGLGVPGLIAAVCFLLFFAGHYVAGLTGYEVAAVFFLGILLVVFEVVFFPGVLFFAGAGSLLMVFSVAFAMVDYWPSRPFVFSYDTVGGAAINLGIAALSGVGCIFVLARYLPAIPVLGGIFLKARLGEDSWAGGRGGAKSAGGFGVGSTGVAAGNLRPSGRALFGETPKDVTTEGDFIAGGTKVRVVRIEGFRVFVEKDEAI